MGKVPTGYEENINVGVIKRWNNLPKETVEISL